MKVTLLNYTQNAKDLLIFTKNTRLKMNALSISDIKNMSENDKIEQLNYMINTIKSSWEFMDFTFMIEGVSRAFTHQFVRNRMGSYAQQTMRIIDMDDFQYVTGPSIVTEEQRAIYEMVMDEIKYGYQKLIKCGVKIEDARGVLPTNICTNIVAKYNLRTLSDMMQSRQSPRTQNEFREVIDEMYNEVVKAEDWLKPFLKNSKHYALNEIQNIFQKKLNGVELVNAIKLVDKIRSMK